MKLDLKTIERRFARGSKTYDNEAIIQSCCAEFLCQKLYGKTDFSVESILDCGAGTGSITKLLLAKFPQSSFFLNDLSRDMLDVCQVKFSDISRNKIHFLHGNMLDLSGSYDIVVSNLAMQWVPNLGEACQRLLSLSKHLFAFSLLLDGSFRQWYDLIKQYQPIEFLTYPNKKDIVAKFSTILPQEQIEFYEQEFALKFNSAKDVLQHLQALGANASGAPMKPSAMRQLLSRSAEQISLNYKILFVFMKVI